MQSLVKTYCANVDCLQDDILYKAAFSLLPQYRQKAVNRYYFDKDRRLAVGVRMLLVHALFAEGFDMNHLTVIQNEHGKPAFANGPHFNLSHSGNQAMCAICWNVPVGCDIEGYTDVTERLTNYCMQPSEAQAIFAHTGAERQLEFCRRWTLKESYMKALGMGMALPPISFALKFTEDGHPYVADDNSCALAEFPPPDTYCASACALCSEAVFAPLQTIDLSEII